MSNDPPRLVTVWCPDWPVVAARVPTGQPAAVFRGGRVIARTPAAVSAGVKSGDRRRSAQRTCPDLLVLDHQPDHAAREFEPVIRAVAEMAPRLEVVEPGWLCVVARGPSRYFGGDVPMAEGLAEVVRKIIGAPIGGVGVGIADGRSTSAIAARRAANLSSGVLVVPAGGSPTFVASLPITWLTELGEATPELVDLFIRLGLRSLGDLAALSVPDVLARFGNEGLHAHHIAAGGDSRLTSATDPAPEWWVEHVFEEPVEQLESVVFITKRLADDLVARLAAEGRVCVRLVVIIETEHGERQERAWYRDHGLSAVAMVERARWQLEGWANKPSGLSGAVALVRLVPSEVRSDSGVQIGLWGGRSQADHDAARAVVRLTGMAGEQAVLVPAWHGGRLPADRYRLVPAASADLEDSSARLDRGLGPWPGAVPTPSPAVVPEMPVPINVVDALGVAVRVTGRGDISAPPAEVLVGANHHRVVAWAGPWPVEQHWWSLGQQRRIARFQLVTEQGIAYLVGVEQQRWLILATYS